MNRRVFLLASFFQPIFFRFSSIFRPDSAPLKVVYKSVPKDKKPSLVTKEGFFSGIYENRSLENLNESFFLSGKIWDMRSQLLSDGKTVITQYLYKNRRAFMECEKMWKKMSPPPDKDPVKVVIVDLSIYKPTV